MPMTTCCPIVELRQSCFATDNSPNNFPALPIREGENVFITFALFADPSAYKPGKISQALARRLKGPATVLRLSPTSRSQLHV